MKNFAGKPGLLKSWPLIAAFLLSAVFLFATAPRAEGVEIGRKSTMHTFMCITAEEAVSVAKADQASNGDSDAIQAAIAQTKQCGVATVFVLVKALHSSYPLADGTTTYVLELEGEMGDGTKRSVWALSTEAPKGVHAT